MAPQIPPLLAVRDAVCCMGLGFLAALVRALAPWLGFSLRIGPAPLTAAAGLGAPGVIALLLFRALCLL